MDAHRRPDGCARHRTSDSRAAARRLACDANVGALVLDVDGSPLSYGHLVRTAQPRLRTAINVRDGGCVFPGCDRPPEWAEAHHIVHWAHGGTNDLTNMALLCRFHHHAVHEGGFGMRGSPRDGTLRFTRPDGTPLPDR